MRDLDRTSAEHRTLGLWSATALVVGHTIGVGIFLTPAELIGTVALPAITFGLWLGCGILSLAGALTFGELASRYPQAGGPYIYLREGWGRRTAFLYGWQSLLITDPGVTAALATGASPYLVVLWPSWAGAEKWLAVGLIWALTLLTIVGLRLSARVMTVLTVGKVLALIAVFAVAFTRSDGSWSHFAGGSATSAGAVPALPALAAGLVSVFFSFGGFWEASRIADEVRRPRRTVPLALGLGVACVTLTYVLTTMAFIYLVPPREISGTTAFARLAGTALFGAAGPTIFALVVVVSVVTSAMALLIMAPRLYVAMSADGLFPAALAAISPRTAMPIRATLLLASLASLFAVAGTFQQIVTFFMCSMMAFVGLSAAALIPLRRRSADAAAFSVPGHPLTTVLFAGSLAAVIVLIAVSRPFQALAGFALVLAGVPAYRLIRVGR